MWIFVLTVVVVLLKRPAPCLHVVVAIVCHRCLSLSVFMFFGQNTSANRGRRRCGRRGVSGVGAGIWYRVGSLSHLLFAPPPLAASARSPFFSVIIGNNALCHYSNERPVNKQLLALPRHFIH